MQRVRAGAAGVRRDALEHVAGARIAGRGQRAPGDIRASSASSGETAQGTAAAG